VFKRLDENAHKLCLIVGSVDRRTKKAVFRRQYVVLSFSSELVMN